MSKINYLTTKKIATLKKISERRVQAKIKQGHYPNAIKCPCDQSWLIPESDLSLPVPDRRRKAVND